MGKGRSQQNGYFGLMGEWGPKRAQMAYILEQVFLSGIQRETFTVKLQLYPSAPTFGNVKRSRLCLIPSKQYGPYMIRS